MAKITWNDRENSGPNSRVSASIFNDTKESVNDAYDIIEAKLGNTNETYTAITASIVSASTVNSDFSLYAHSASFQYISASTGDFDANTIRLGGTPFSKEDVDKLRVGKSISRTAGKQLVNENDDTTYVRMSTAGRATHYAGDNVTADFKSDQVTLGGLAGASTGLPVSMPGGITGSLNITGSTSITGSTDVTGSFGVLGDVDFDGEVTINDLLIVLANYSQTGSFNLQGDTDFDGIVNVQDLLNVLGGFAASGSSSNTGSFENSGSFTNDGTGSFTGSFDVSGSTTFSGSFNQSGSFNSEGSSSFTGSFEVTGSGRFNGGVAFTGSEFVTNPTTTTSSLLSVYPSTDPEAWIGIDSCGNIVVNCEANILNNANTIDYAGTNQQTKRSAIFGLNNTVYGASNIAAGQSLKISASSAPGTYARNAAFGRASSIQNSFDAFVAGDTNSIEGSVLQRGGFAIGSKNKIIDADYAFASGRFNSSSGDYSFSEGSGSKASGTISHAGGQGTIASGYGSWAIGKETVSSGEYTLAGGLLTSASGDHAVTFASSGSVAIGRFSTVIAANHSTSSGNYSAVIGALTGDSKATGEGSVVVAGERSTNEGKSSLSSRNGRIHPTATGSVAFQSGVVSGSNSVALNDGFASGSDAVAMGTATAISSGSLAIGLRNDLTNAANEKQLFVIGKGEEGATPRDAFEVTTDTVIIDLANLPTSEPTKDGQLWRDTSGYLRIKQ